jgi:SIR2-like domain
MAKKPQVPIPETASPGSSTESGRSETASGSPTHCPYRRATDLLQRLAPGKMRVGFLIGAGCSCAIRVPAEGGKTRSLIPDITALTGSVRALLGASEKYQAVAGDMWSKVVARNIATPTIEDILSHLRTLQSISGTHGIDGFAGELLKDLDKEICAQVRKIVNQTLPTNDTPYHTLASWIQAIAREKPVELFTTNYDLCLEQALEERRVPYFDGFVGSDSAFLDLESMAEDDLPARWARLWKIHGSVNWWMGDSKRIRRSRDQGDGEQLLIYPSHLKYDQSRQMPYTAMLDRLRVFLRSGQCVLLTCGFSFGDEHINAFIAQGLSGNPNACCIGMLFNDRIRAPLAVALARRHANFTLLAADGAVVGTIERDWHSEASGNHPNDRCKWTLGDFAAFGHFLGHQLSNRDLELSVADAY